MDQKSNVLSSSREHIAELSDIIKTAILREVGIRNQNIANKMKAENISLYDMKRKTNKDF